MRIPIHAGFYQQSARAIVPIVRRSMVGLCSPRVPARRRNGFAYAPLRFLVVPGRTPRDLSLLVTSVHSSKPLRLPLPSFGKRTKRPRSHGPRKWDLRRPFGARHEFFYEKPPVRRLAAAGTLSVACGCIPTQRAGQSRMLNDIIKGQTNGQSGDNIDRDPTGISFYSFRRARIL